MRKIFHTLPLLGFDPCEKRINILGGHAWRHFFMACSKLEATAIYLVKKACGNDKLACVYKKSCPKIAKLQSPPPSLGSKVEENTCLLKSEGCLPKSTFRNYLGNLLKKLVGTTVPICSTGLAVKDVRRFFAPLFPVKLTTAE